MKNLFLNSLKEYRNIFELAVEGILIAEIETKVIKYANKEICIMFGYSYEEIIGKTIFEIHPSEQFPELLSRFYALSRGEIKLVKEIPCKRKTGDTFLADISGSRIDINGIACNVGFFTDVTDQKQIVDAMQASEQQYKLLFMSLHDGFYLSETIFDERGDPCDYKFLEVNPAFERIIGMRRDQIIGKRYKELVPVDTTRWLETYFMVAKKGNPLSYEFYSEEYHMYFETYSYQPKKGQVCVLVKDVTARKRMEEALRNAQKLESLGVLAGGIAHDFNNLMGGILGYIDLAKSCSMDAEASNYLEKALGSINRARSLTMQLLTFAKGGAPVLKVGSLLPVLHEAVEFSLSGSNVSCDFDIQDDLYRCNFDKDQIGQVIDNIVINAQHAMPAGGTIKLIARNITFQENEHLILKEGNYVKISITDHGIGIPHQLLARIFDPFFTTKPKGHGLGLATCYSIIKRHGGAIDVESEPGKGSTFHFYLPESVGGEINQDSSSKIKHGGSGTIILMDDEHIMRDVIAKMLVSLGYTVKCTKNGKETLDLFIAESNENRPVTALILDLTIPGGMGGKETNAEIRKVNPTVPVFVSSGYADDPVMQDPCKYGFTASICKPFLKETLMATLSKYLSA